MLLIIYYCCSHNLLPFRLIPHLNIFVKSLSGHLGEHVGQLLCEVFSGEPSNTLKVKEEHIIEMMNLIFVYEREANTSVDSSILNVLLKLLVVRMQIT